MKQSKQMASEQQDDHRHRWGEEQQHDLLSFGIKTDVGQPPPDRGEREQKNLEEVEASSPTGTPGQRKKLQQAAGRQHHRQNKNREWEKPFDPMLQDELIGSLQDLEG